jgi:uncharacterized protein YggE
MKNMIFALAVFCAIGCAVSASASAQEVQVSPTNRTITAQATATVSVDPELAIVGVGYQNYGRSKDEAFAQNKRAAQKIIQALLDAGIPQDTIETDDLQVSAVEQDKELPPAERKDRQYHAQQSWRIRVAVPEAQKVVDLAVSAGATEVQPVQWIVTDLQILDDKAATTALEKARGLAEQMAKQMGVRLGMLLSASNGGINEMESMGRAQLKRIVTVSEQAQPSLKLFPQKILRTTTVFVTYAIE